MTKRILVIDDSQEILDVLEDLLTEAGYRAILHESCLQDLDAVKRARPDLIISDYGDYVPAKETHCWQFLEELKRDGETATIPLIICTTSCMLAQDHADWLRAHDVQVVAKPFDVDAVLQAVARQLGRAETDPVAPDGEADGV
jgi:CheY-like chemotaxis protein